MCKTALFLLLVKKFVHKQCRVSRSSVVVEQATSIVPLLRLFCNTPLLDITKLLLRNVGFTVCVCVCPLYVLLVDRCMEISAS